MADLQASMEIILKGGRQSLMMILLSYPYRLFTPPPKDTKQCLFPLLGWFRLGERSLTALDSLVLVAGKEFQRNIKLGEMMVVKPHHKFPNTVLEPFQSGARRKTVPDVLIEEAVEKVCPSIPTQNIMINFFPVKNFLLGEVVFIVDSHTTNVQVEFSKNPHHKLLCVRLII